VAIVDDLWLAALTKNEDDAGSDNRFNLTIDVDGVDVVDKDFILAWGVPAQGGAPAQGHDGLEQGQAGFQESGVLSTPFESNALTNSSIRLGIRGDDAWGPQHVLLLGRTQPAFTPGRIVALAMETDLTHWLSSDSSEGHLTMRLRLVGSGSSTTVIRRVLLLVYTDHGSDVETDSPIQLQIAAGGALVLDQQISDTPQDDLEQYTANWYFLDVDVPFTKSDIGGISLSILGTDAWLPKTVFVFGLDTEAGRPNEVVALVTIPEWGLGWLSADPQEGNQSIALPVSI
jgi:hypothetical protein